jgi:mono/diheme cytochrome c family protein
LIRPTALALATLALVGACHAARRHPATPAPAASPAVARGAALYAKECTACHGADGMSVGPLAEFLQLAPADLRDPALLARDDDALVARLRDGTPLTLPAARNPVVDDLQVDALEAYLPTLGGPDTERLRGGRLVYESACAPCHGPYGRGDGPFASLTEQPAADLIEARSRYTDAALIAIAKDGFGAMPLMEDDFDPGEPEMLVAWIRHFSPGFRIYDTYCAVCHGEDGGGTSPAPTRPPVLTAPPLTSARLARLPPAERRAKILHMLERERQSMPHFQGRLDEAALRDVVAYLKSRPAPAPVRPPPSLPRYPGRTS